MVEVCALCAADSSMRDPASRTIVTTHSAASTQYTSSHARSAGAAWLMKALNSQLPTSTPSMKVPSMVVVRRPCAARSAVSRPIEEYTPTLASANETPTQVNSASVVRKLGHSGISTQAAPSSASARIIARR